MTEKQEQQAYNTRKQNQNLIPPKKETQKRWSTIVKELGSRKISFSDIANGEKLAGLAGLAQQESLTLTELGTLSTYARWIEFGDTKAATFLRDTAGEAPKQEIDISTTHQSGLSQLTITELQELADLLRNQAHPVEDTDTND